MNLCFLVLVLLFRPFKIAETVQVEDKLIALVDYCLANPEILTKNAFFGINFADAIISRNPLSLKRVILKRKLKVLREIFRDSLKGEKNSVFDFVVDPHFWAENGNFSRKQLHSLPMRISLEAYHDLVDWGSPSERESDECLEEISGKVCLVSNKCWKIEAPEGIAFGYHQTHKLIFHLVLSRKRSCKVLRTKSYKIIQKLCRKILSELLTIEQLQFPKDLRDLAMEQIFLCSFSGFPEFLKPQWIEKITSWQDKSGCFPESQTICSDHMTGVGAALLALILKYFEEKTLAIFL